MPEVKQHFLVSQIRPGIMTAVVQNFSQLLSFAAVLLLSVNVSICTRDFIACRHNTFMGALSFPLALLPGLGRYLHPRANR